MGKPLVSQDPLIGQVVGGRYEIVRLIGKGGMGAIYEIRNTRLGRSFALKTLIGEAAENADVIQRFRREADVIARIKHPHIVEVIDWESLEDGSPCMVLEYLRGDDLSTRIRDAAPMPWPFIARVGDQILSALATAHAAGVVHRDLKPQNVFLSADDSGVEAVKLLDFGISKIRDSRSLVTTDARLLGTPSYMSPEQAEGRSDDIGVATDVWAMGAILYELATGELAFEGASMPAVLYRICSREADAVNAKRGDAPPEFVQLVRETLTRDLADRIPDAVTLRARLRAALREVSGMQYSEQFPAVRGTPLPTRRKRLTGATDQTVSSGSHTPPGAQTTPITVSAPGMPTPTGAGQVSTSTLPLRTSKRMGLLLASMGAGILAMLVVVIVLATRSNARHDARPAASPPVAGSPIDAPVIVEPPADAASAAVVADAAAPVVPLDAAVHKGRPSKPAPKQTPKQVPASQDPPSDPPKADPPKPDPPKKKPCAKDDADCAFGDGT